MKKVAFLLCLMGCALLAKAQGNADLEKNRVALGGLLTSSDTWQMDLSYHYMMLPYVGVALRWAIGLSLLSMVYHKETVGALVMTIKRFKIFIFARRFILLRPR